METSEVKKATKQVGKKSTSAAIRVAVETRKKLLAELAKVNKKPNGKRIKMDALLLRLLTKITTVDVAELQAASLTGRDRMEQSYRAYCAQFGEITLDEFFAQLSEQAASQIASAKVAKS